MKAKIMVQLTIIILLFNSCYTLNVAEIKNNDKRLPFNDMDLKMSFEVYDLRIDLLRETTTQTVSSREGASATETVNVPYHYLGVYLFEGVFLDLNNNLCFNVIDLIDKTYKKDFEIGQKNKLKQSAKFFYTVKRQGNEVVCEYRNFLGNSVTKVQFLDSVVRIEGSGLKTKQDIQVKKDRLVYIPGGLFGKLSKMEIVKTEKNVKYQIKS